MVHSNDGKYNARTHLAEMIALLGTPPEALLQREREGRQFRWRTARENDEGKLCDSATAFFGGPFFDPKGTSPYIIARISLLILILRRVYVSKPYTESS